MCVSYPRTGAVRKVKRRLGDEQFLLTFNGPRTMPLNSSGVIRKPAKRRP
ncbi:MAG: hypothetical protein NVS2B15_23970 [Pseudarthrobacter sp.]